MRIVVTDDLERPRLTVLFRLFLAIPHLVWLMLWSVAVVPRRCRSPWVIALVLGRLPSALHRFLAAYVRYATHVIAFVYVVGRPLPGLHGPRGLVRDRRRDRPAGAPAAGSTILFRFVLAIPAFIVASALGGVAFVIAFLGWWYALVTGADARGSAQPRRRRACATRRRRTRTRCFVTDRYPYAAPVLREQEPEPEPEPSVDPYAPFPETRSEAAPGSSRRRGAHARRVPPLPDRRPGRPRAPGTSTSTPSSAPTSSTRAKRYERFFYVDWVLAQIALLVTLWIYAKRGAGVRARVVGRADRHRDAARHARARHRLARARPVRARGALVAAPVRPERPQLPRLARSRTGPCSPRSSSRSASRSSS